MYPSSRRAKQTTLSSFLASEWTADNGKRSKTDAENEDQMSGKRSIESPGRIDTRIAMGFDGGKTWDLIEACPQDCLQVSFAAHPMEWMHDRPIE